MKKIDVIDVLEHLSRIYIGRFEADAKTLDAWFLHLEDQSKDAVFMKLKTYVLNNKYPPTVFDLVSNKYTIDYFNFNDQYSNGENKE